MLTNWMPNKDSEVPLYEQIALYYKDAIANGLLSEGDRLPGRNKLLARFNVSKSTVTTALEKLTAEGVLNVRPRSGYFVSGSVSRRPDWQAHTAYSRHKLTPKSTFFSDPSRIADFGMGREFDIKPFTKRPVSVDPSSKNSKYGLEPLRESLAVHLKSYGIHTEPDNILIGPRFMEMLNLIYHSFFGYRTSFLYEQACLTNAAVTAEEIGMYSMTIPMDEMGMSALELEKKLFRCENPVVQINPSCHAPTGIIMPLKRREEILNIAVKYRSPILELAPLDELSDFPPSLKSMDATGNVIYLGGFTKCYPIELPVSWVVADKAVIDCLADYMRQMASEASTLQQSMVYQMLINGDYKAMIESMRSYVDSRKAFTLELLDNHLFGKARWVKNNCLFHFWIELERLSNQKTGEIPHVYPGYLFDKDNTTHVVMCPPSHSEAEIEHAIVTLARLFA